MSDIESQQEVANELEVVLERIKQQVSSVEQSLQASQKHSSELTDKIGELKRLRNGIDWYIWLVGSAQRFTAIIVIVLFLIVLCLLWYCFPNDWTAAQVINSGSSGGVSIGSTQSLHGTSTASSLGFGESLLCVLQDGGETTSSPAVDERIQESSALGDSLKKDSEESTEAGNKGSAAAEPMEPAQESEDASSAPQATIIEAEQHPSVSTEVSDIQGSAIRAKDRKIIFGSDRTVLEIPGEVVELRIRPQDETSDLEKASPVSIADVSQEKSMSIHQARLWSFAILAFSVVVVFGTVVLALVKLVATE